MAVDDKWFLILLKNWPALNYAESVSVGGFGAEIAATVAEQLFSVLKSPITRCAAPRVPISYAPPLEAKIRVSSEQIVEAARKSVAVSASFK